MQYLALLITALAAPALSAQPGIPPMDGTLPDFIRASDVHVTPVRHGGEAALSVAFGTDAPWPNLNFQAPEPWDWRDYAALEIGLYNPGDAPVTLSLRVDNEGANGTDHCNTQQQLIPPKQSATMTLHFNTEDRARFWGMRGIPVRGPMGTGAPLDLSRITAWQLFLNRPSEPQTLLVTSVALTGEGGDLGDKVPFPFIDAYGQYKHMDWPGKIASDAELRRAHDAVAAARSPIDREALDAFGGWRGGPKQEATGWFRTEQIGGTWWLVTPDGHLFFSAGADCVGTWSHTFVEGRRDWFEWLPEEDDPRFRGTYGYAKNAHSMAETIGGEGQTFGFYAANLIRLHGEGWQAAWRDETLARLKSWGFNTVGNWSAWDVMHEGDMPFVVHLSLASVRPIAAAAGYWAPMMDVYDPSFAEAVDRATKGGTDRWRDNNRCIGYFVDNELAWEGVVQGVLGSGPEQPARVAFLAFLQERHGGLEGLNTAWGTDFSTWEALTEPERRTEVASADLDAFLEAFAATYFETIAEAMGKYAPNQLYLGSRFATAPEPVVRACARFADVVSFNIYAPELGPRDSALFHALDKPVIIGEFHFGATDRGMFHTGLVPVATQAERGSAYVRYLESMLRHPAVVGTHWFQYMDQPTTGRHYDGENYNIGLVDVTDQPYPHLTGAAAELHRRMYPLRYALGEGDSP